MKELKRFLHICDWVFKIVYLIAGLAVIFGVLYVFARYSMAGQLIGNDVPNAFIYIQWLDHYWPNIPLWWPEQGAGVSFVYGHQIGSYFIILFLHKVLGFTLIEGTKLLGFFSIYLTCVGIYAFTWLKTKSQTAAFLAGIFYLLPNGIYRWLFDMGLYAQSVSLMFVPPVMIFYDRFLEAYRMNQEKKKRIFLFLTGIMFAFMLFSHIITGFTISFVMILYAIFYFQFEKINLNRVKRFFLGVKTWFFAWSSGMLLLAFWIFPYIRLYFEEDRDKSTFNAPHQIPYFSLKTLFGYLNIKQLQDNMWVVSLELGVALLFFIGLFIAAFKKKSIFSWGLVALLFFVMMVLPGFNFEFIKIFYGYHAIVGVRGILVLSIIFPILAGYACVALPGLLIDPLRRSRGFFANQVGNLFISVCAIVIGLYFVLSFRIPQTGTVCMGYLKAEYIGFGPSSDGSNCKYIQDFAKGKARILPFALGDDDIVGGKGARALIARIDPGIKSRVDFSPSFGNYVMLWNIYSHTSQISLYAYGLSFFRNMWGYQQGMFYGSEAVDTWEVKETAKWFGIQRVITAIGLNNSDNFPSKYWNLIYDESKNIYIANGIQKVFSLKEKVNLAELSSRPSILVISDHEKRAFENVFRLANKGAFPYDNYYLAESESKYVDSYSLDELKNFDLIILHAYNYKDQNKAENLLDSYVSNGGRLWIETGWQYNSPDWLREKTPLYMPLQKQEWTNLGTVNNYQLNKQIAKGIDINKFAPLKYEDGGWGFSSAKDSLRDWAEPVLSVSQYPLVVVGKYGQGKILWSGMNLFAHAYNNFKDKKYFEKNNEEIKFINSLASWLLSDYTPSEGRVSYKRPNPDLIYFTIDAPGKWLLWKEAYTPLWRATIKTPEGKSQSLNYYRAGPGFMEIYIPKEYQKSGNIIELHYVQSWAGYLGYIATALAILWFILYLTGMDKLIKRKLVGDRRMTNAVGDNMKAKIKGWWEKDESDEDY